MQTSAASGAEPRAEGDRTGCAFIAPYYLWRSYCFAQQRYAEEKELLLEAQKLDATDCDGF